MHERERTEPMRPALTTAICGSLFLILGAGAAQALEATMQLTTPEGPGETVGTVEITGGAEGTVFTPDLKGLPPGDHGFHVHAKGSCAPGQQDGKTVPALAAGGHWDPDATDRHEGPAGHGHLGDLPVLVVAPDGTATQAVTAPRITDPQRLKGMALMIHAGGDNYSDQPKPLGGGGARLACGVIE
jgi:Cu-Zn family superoxide dismutase